MNPFAYRMNARRLVIGVACAVVAYVLYLSYYDILIPGLPEGSYRLATTLGFAVASFLLVGGQILIGGFLINVMAAFGRARNEDCLKGDSIASVMTVLFALTYAIFPHFGPFYYIVFSATQGAWYVMLFEVLWSAFIVLIGAALIRWQYNIRLWHALVFATVAYIFITVAAS